MADELVRYMDAMANRMYEASLRMRDVIQEIADYERSTERINQLFGTINYPEIPATPAATPMKNGDARKPRELTPASLRDALDAAEKAHEDDERRLSELRKQQAMEEEEANERLARASEQVEAHYRAMKEGRMPPPLPPKAAQGG